MYKLAINFVSKFAIISIITVINEYYDYWFIIELFNLNGSEIKLYHFSLFVLINKEVLL